MCGIFGIFDTKKRRRIDKDNVIRATKLLTHRGPDDIKFHFSENLAFGFSRLSIVDLEHGGQPFFSDDGKTVSICNGEIYNYKKFRIKLEKQGHQFKTDSDCEVILHGFKELCEELPKQLDGQFAYGIYEKTHESLHLARDHFGVVPLFYTMVDGLFIFASEIKAILEVPQVIRKLDLKALDQVFSFPGLISPRTFFKGIYSLKPGYTLRIDQNGIKEKQYWDLKIGEYDNHSNRGLDSYLNEFDELLTTAVHKRLQADVPIGLYLSGGLDSTLIGSLMRKIVGPHTEIKSFSMDFSDPLVSEGKFQRVAAKTLGTDHHERIFCASDIISNLKKVIWHTECALKETFNTAALTLSELAKANNTPVILAGQGADELLAGYIGYRFDGNSRGSQSEFQSEEDSLREQLWGDKDFFYEKNQFAFRAVKRSMYSDRVNERFDEIDSTNNYVIDRTKLKDLDSLHKRSYIDLKLRLADHLLGDHGDRMVMANSIEGRYPFLDVALAEFIGRIPSNLKVRDFTEKYILKKLAVRHIPEIFTKREKFGFTAPGSSYLIQTGDNYIEHLLSNRFNNQHGIFNTKKIEELRKNYSKPGFRINVPFESDLLMPVITTNILIDLFEIDCF